MDADKWDVRIWYDSPLAGGVANLDVMRADIPEQYQDAVILLDAAADSEGRAQIMGVGRRRVIWARPSMPSMQMRFFITLTNKDAVMNDDNDRDMLIWTDGKDEHEPLLYQTSRADIPEKYRDAVMLLDAAADDNGYAHIVGVGKRRVSSSYRIAYDLDEDGRAQIPNLASEKGESK